MKRMELRVRLNEARTEATIELCIEGKPLGQIHLPAAELEGFIHQLASHRWRMAEEVPPELDPGVRLEAVPDAAWQTPEKWKKLPSGGAEGKMLALRHPGLGWLTFLFSDKEAQRIAEYLAGKSPKPSS